MSERNSAEKEEPHFLEEVLAREEHPLAAHAGADLVVVRDVRSDGAGHEVDAAHGQPDKKRDHDPLRKNGDSRHKAHEVHERQDDGGTQQA